MACETEETGAPAGKKKDIVQDAGAKNEKVADADSTQVIELPPPYVQTELGGSAQATDPRAMPLAEFIAVVMDILTTRPDVQEVIVKRCEPLRYAAETGNFDHAFGMVNAIFESH